MKTANKIESFHQIEKRNDAITLCRDYLKLSSVLIPYYNELLTKKRDSVLSIYELMGLERLRDTYIHNNGVKEEMSEILFNSSIFTLIKNTVEMIEIDPGSAKTNGLIATIQIEYRSLGLNWDKTMLN